MFSPDGRYLALGSYDECLRVLNTLTWEVVLDDARHDAHPKNLPAARRSR